MPDPDTGAAGPGIVQSLRNLATTLVALLRTRFELLATELEEERARLLLLLFWAAGALFFLGVGLLLLTVLVVALFWDTYRISAVVTLAAIFLGAGIYLAVGVHRRMHAPTRLFSASLDELARDKDRLTPR